MLLMLLVMWDWSANPQAAAMSLSDRPWRAIALQAFRVLQRRRKASGVIPKT
jgi:hypothetical protein